MKFENPNYIDTSISTPVQYSSYGPEDMAETTPPAPTTTKTTGSSTNGRGPQYTQRGNVGRGREPEGNHRAEGEYHVLGEGGGGAGDGDYHILEGPAVATYEVVPALTQVAVRPTAQPQDGEYSTLQH